jgi:hypothetical protein
MISSATTDIWPKGQARRGWRGRELRTRDLVLPLSLLQISTIRSLLENINKSFKPLTQIEKADFSHPLIDDFFQQVGWRVRHGRGLVILTGLAGLSEADLRVVHWGIGTHLGSALSQNSRGDRVVEITRTQDSDRGSGSSEELVMHTDPAEIIILLVVRRAMAGGISRFCSSIAAWDTMRRECPDLVRILQTGFRCWRYGEQATGDDEYTPYSVPVFSEYEGLRSVVYARADDRKSA